MRIVILLLIGSFLASCTETHLINDKEFRNKVETRFNERSNEILKNRSDALLSVFDTPITTEEKEALQFMYAYAPLCDLADYDGDFYLSNIRNAFDTRTAFEWSHTIPNNLFLNYVLPIRSSNENIDNSRPVFFNEIKERIKGLSMMDAALEVNHWCHEKVTYKGTDVRTMSPLNSVKTAFGRCGEESVFAVAAYRSVGIPCRQVYTPRWAHSDDNHAWIEVWIDGKWYFTGACEPEAKLNMGWFAGPAGRGMLMRGSTFGELAVPDADADFTGYFSYINITENYTSVAEVELMVTDTNDKPIEDAEVGFCLYNYAELYPITTKITDENGLCSAKLGLGDILLWIKKDNTFTYEKITIGENPSIKIALNQKPLTNHSYNFNMVPPTESIPFKTTATEEEKNKNNLRKKEDIAIRKAYENSFISREESNKVAQEVSADEAKTWKFLKGSRGNHKEIAKFIKSVDKTKLELAYKLLDVISYKDLWDTPADILLSHLNNAAPNNKEYSLDFYTQNIVNPRVTNELIRPYKKELQSGFSNSTVEQVIEWIKKNLTISERENSYRMPLSPVGTYQLKYCDSRSRNVFFVSTCRSIGIAAKLDEATQEPVYFENNRWIQATFNDKDDIAEKSTLIIKNDPNNSITPTYYKNFTIAKLENGSYKTLSFDKGKATLDFPEGINLETGDVKVNVPIGNYMMVSGNRLKDGAVLTQAKFFSVIKDQATTVTVEIRNDEAELDIIGKIDLNATLRIESQELATPISKIAMPKGAVIAWLDPEREPTKHFMLDISKLTNKFEQWDGKMVFCATEQKDLSAISKFSLPKNGSTALDTDILKKLEQTLSEQLIGEYPVIIIINNNGEIVFLNKGYRIGLGEQLLKTLEKI